MTTYSDQESVQTAFAELQLAEGFDRIIAKVNLLQRLQTLLITTEPELAGNCTVANWENGCLVLATYNAAWGAKLRYLVPELLKRLIIYPEFRGLTTIRCQVLPQQTVAKKRDVRAKVSAKTTQLLNQTAARIKDENLKTALLHLAKNN